MTLCGALAAILALAAAPAFADELMKKAQENLKPIPSIIPTVKDNAVTRLSVTSKMGESGREAAASWRMGGVLSLGFLPCDDGLVKATKLNKGNPHPGKRCV